MNKKPKRLNVIIATVLTVVLVLATSLNAEASGTTYYVATDGNDSNPGTIDRPFRTIQEAVDRAQAGDTVYVRAGTYVEKVTISNSGTATAPITVAAYPDEEAVIDGDWTLPTDDYPGGKWVPLVLITGDHVALDGFEVKNSRGRGVEIYEAQYCELRNLNIHHVWSSGIQDEGERSLVEDCKVWQACRSNAPPNRGVEDWPSGFVAVNHDHHTFRRNEVFNNHGEGMSVLRAGHVTIEDNTIYDNLTAQLYIDNGDNVTVQRNLIYSTDDREFWRTSDAPGSGLAICDEPYSSSEPTGHDRTIVNNIIVGNGVNIHYWQDLQGGGLKNDVIANNTLVEAVRSGDGGSIGIKIGSGNHSDTRVENNIILQMAGSPAMVADDPDLQFSHNLWSQSVSGRASSPNDVIGDPKLVNPNAERLPGSVSPDWYRLEESSPARDEARVIAEATEDFFGGTRGNNPDMGAHEYGATPPTPPPPPPQVLYTFEEGGGATVRDVSGVGAPLSLTIESGSATSWLSGALSINSPVLISSAGAATKIIDACKGSHEISIEAWVKPANTTQGGPARIVTLSDGVHDRNFTLAQEESTYETRLRTTTTGDNGSDPLLTASTVTTSELSHVVYTRDTSGVARFYANGVEVGSRSDITGNFSNWDEGFRFGLANEFGADRPWLGELHLVAIYDRALSQAEVMRNFNAGPSRAPPLLLRIWLPLVLREDC